jgi:hypothetical protein
MTLAQLKAAIKAVHPSLTFRVTDGEARISVNPAFFQEYDGLTYPQACDRAEGIAIYETCKDTADRECCLENAKHLYGYSILPRIKA